MEIQQHAELTPLGRYGIDFGGGKMSSADRAANRYDHLTTALNRARRVVRSGGDNPWSPRKSRAVARLMGLLKAVGRAGDVEMIRGVAEISAEPA
jgi:hypothetical protein